MSKQSDGGPAFPGHPDNVFQDGQYSRVVSGAEGMSLRAYFAGQAMAALLSNPEAVKALVEEAGFRLNEEGFRRMALSARVAADALLSELSKGEVKG